MTIQVGMCAHGAVVLTSDTKVRTSEKAWTTNKPVVQSVVHQSKIVFGSRHNIAVAMAGEGAIGTDPARDLAENLSGITSLPSGYIGPKAIEWGKTYAERYLSKAIFNPELPMFSLLVVTPDADGPKLCKLNIGREVVEIASSRYLVNGHDNSPAMFWLEWMGADDPLIGLEAATGIAITTVLTAGELNPYGIGGIEVHQFSNGAWKHWGEAERNHAAAQYKNQANKIKDAIISLGRPVIAPVSGADRPSTIR